MILPLLIMVAACVFLWIRLPLPAGAGTEGTAGVGGISEPRSTAGVGSLADQSSTARQSSKTGLSGSVLFTFIDVGQGDAILVSTSDGHHMLVDGGPRSAGPALAARLRELGIEHLVFWYPRILTKTISVVSRTCSTPSQWASHRFGQGPLPRLPLWRYLANRREGHPIRAGRGRDRFRLGDAGLILWPTGALAEDLNDVSVVLRVDYGESSALLTGDIGPGVEAVSGRAQAHRIVLLKVGHHGSRRSNSGVSAPDKAAWRSSSAPPGTAMGIRITRLGQADPKSGAHLQDGPARKVVVRLTSNPQVWSASMERRGADYRANSSSTVFHFAWCDRAQNIDPARSGVQQIGYRRRTQATGRVRSASPSGATWP